MLLVDYYRAAPDLVQFSQYWCPDTTMLDKIKVTQRFTQVPQYLSFSTNYFQEFVHLESFGKMLPVLPISFLQPP